MKKGFTMRQLARLETDLKSLGLYEDNWRRLFFVLGWPDWHSDRLYNLAEQEAREVWEAAAMYRRDGSKIAALQWLVEKAEGNNEFRKGEEKE
jgi:hypothetical protein